MRLLSQIFCLSLAAISAAAPIHVVAQTERQVVVSGAVPDEKTRAIVMEKLQALYGVGNVIDQIEVGGVAAPPNWTSNVGNMLGASLREIHRGKIEVDGTQVKLQGEVASETKRQEISNTIASALSSSPPAYQIFNGLRVVASPDEQNKLDSILANRVVEFETASAKLTPIGTQLLDELADLLPQLSSQHIQIIGHTDNVGSRTSNLVLSQARADAVKIYLIEKGLPSSRFETTGVGPDHPVVSNDTPEGRARNRRIEFRASNKSAAQSISPTPRATPNTVN
jgi:OOP family OmpA-OmpF porin